MRTFDLTDKEFKAAKLLVADCLSGMGGTRPADLADDEYTWTAAEVLLEAGYSRHEAAGLFSSLAEKGFIFEYEPKSWCVATQGWQWMDTVWEDAR